LEDFVGAAILPSLFDEDVSSELFAALSLEFEYRGVFVNLGQGKKSVRHIHDSQSL